MQYNPLAPSFSFPHGKCSLALPDHKPKQETAGFLQQKGNSLCVPFQPMGMTLCRQRGHGGQGGSVCQGCICRGTWSPEQQPEPAGCLSVFQRAKGPDSSSGARRSINADSSQPGTRGASSGIPTRARESGTWKTLVFKLQKSW